MHPSPVISRSYDSEDDLRLIRGLLMEARARAGIWRYPLIAETMWPVFMALRHLDPRRHIRLWFAGEQLAGYAFLGEDPSFEWEILTDYRDSGIETEATEWMDARLGECRAADPGKWSGPIVAGARQDDPQRIAFLEEKGFRRGGEFSEFNLIRPLTDPIPERPLPPGFQIRPVSGPAEAPARAAIHRDVWSPWSVARIDGQDYLHLMHLPGYKPELDLVVTAPDGAFAAYANGWLDERNRIGDFGPVGAQSAFRRLGLSRAVMAEGLRRMRTLGMERACVSTGMKNAPAIALYQSLGFTIVNQYLEFIR
jgi:mycothiol synthase